MADPYKNLKALCAPLHGRSLHYRFDVESDVPWDQWEDPGDFLGPKLAQRLGIHLERLTPEARTCVQGSVALSICEAFCSFEEHILAFTREEGLNQACVTDLCLEETRHIAMFQELARRLRCRFPGWSESFDDCADESRAVLKAPFSLEGYESAGQQHHLFWTATLFFEEWTLFFHRALQEESVPIQPTWAAAHRLHAREEAQHIPTDLAHLKALDLDSDERSLLAQAFRLHVERALPHAWGLHTTRNLLDQVFPGQSQLLEAPGLWHLPHGQELATDTSFRHTRIWAPGFAESTSIAGGETLVSRFRQTMRDHPNKGIRYLTVGAPDRLESYPALFERAQSIRAHLQQNGLAPRRSVLLEGMGLPDTVGVFWACLLEGALPSIVKDASILRSSLDNPMVIRGDSLQSLQKGEPGPPWEGNPKAAALVQFSSGTTGRPKGLGLTHRGILHNIDSIVAARTEGPEAQFLSWLPLHHDMGLIGYHLLPLATGANQVLMEPGHFVRRPREWLSRISKHKISCTASPDFGLAHVTKMIPDVTGLDLSGVRCLLNGAEPISSATLRAFLDRFEPAGFRPEALCPGYGLAEATLCVTLSRPGEIPAWREFEEGMELVDLGAPLEGVEVRVVDADGAEVSETIRGQIQVRSPGRCLGSPDWINTGDDGCMAEGHLFVVGRRADRICLEGENLWMEDVERVAASLPGLGPRSVVATGFHRDGRDCLALFVVQPARLDAAGEQALRERIGQTFGLRIASLEQVHRREIPRTSSGKTQRHKLRQRLEGVASRRTDPEPTQPDDLLQQVLSAWQEVLALPAGVIHPQSTFRSLGGRSIQAARIHALLEAALQRNLSHRVVEGVQTPLDMVERIREEAESVAAPTAPTTSTVQMPSPGGAIAIVGVAGRLPGAEDGDAFWQLLSGGHASFGPLPSDRWDPGLHPGDETTFGAWLPRPFHFDPEPFGASEREARSIDPHQRLLLELATDLLDHTGCSPKKLGVYVCQGDTFLDRRQLLEGLNSGSLDLSETLSSVTDNMAAARLASTLGMEGPAVVIQAACASSLVAIHLACRALVQGECEAAIAGGVELLFTPISHILLGRAGVLSKTGACTPFSAGADGFVPGEGGGLVMLKPLERALAEGDRVLAVVAGSAVNNDGGAASRLSPNPAGQEAVLSAAWAQAGRHPGEADWIECHGTGTPIGDAVEASVLTRWLDNRDRPLPLGSAKSNVGHLQRAAGAASLWKVLLAFQHEQIPPIAGATARSDRLPSPLLQPVLAPLAWPRTTEPRRVGISAFGVGGTNCHLVLADAPQTSMAPEASLSGQVLALSAPSPAAMRQVATARLAELKRGDSLPLHHLVASWARGAPRHGWRSATVVESRAGLEEALVALSSGQRNARSQARRVVFAFPGPGSEHPQRVLRLLESSPVFREEFGSLSKGLPFDLIELLQQKNHTIAHAQPLVFATGLALSKTLERLGIQPDAVVGHSAGELVAACVSGALDPAQGMALSVLRGEAMAACSPGGMVAVLGAEERARALLEGAGIDLDLAARNAPDQCVFSGPAQPIKYATRLLSENGLVCRPLPVGCAAHSRWMAPVKAALSAALLDRAPLRPHLAFWSSLHARPMEEIPTAYWQDQVTGTVDFGRTISRLGREGATVFVELGARAVLSSAIESAGEQAIPLLREGESSPLLQALADLYEQGANPNWHRVQPVDPLLPTVRSPYPHQRRDLRPAGLHFNLTAPQAAAPQRSTGGQLVSLETDPLIRDHRAQGRSIAPGSWMLDRLAKLAGRPDTARFQDVWIMRSFQLQEGDLKRLRAVEGEDGQWTLESRERTGEWVAHLSAKRVTQVRVAPVQDLDGIRRNCTSQIPVEEILQRLERTGMVHGPRLQTLTRVYLGKWELLAHLEPREKARHHLLDPGLLDGAFQSLAAFTLAVGDATASPFLGFSMGSLDVFGPLEGPCMAHARLATPLRADSTSLRANVSLFDASGHLRIQVQDFSAKREEVQDTAPLVAEACQDPSMSDPMEQTVRAMVAKALSRPAGSVASHIRFARYGMDSLQAVRVARALGEALEMDLPPTLLFEHPTLAALVAALAQESRADVKG